ncbi:MAG: HAD-IA family hydrolase [Patescibacteria group bacterium]
MKRAIIFDFDGTIGDTIPLMLDIYHKQAETKGWPVITPTTLVMLKKQSLKQAMKWAGVRIWQVPGLLAQGRRYMAKRVDEVRLFDDAGDLITELAKDSDIYILSNNSKSTIELVMKKNGILDMVTVLPRPTLFGKARSINRLVKTNKYFIKDIIMVGDEVRDIEAAKKVGVKSVAVSWGLQDKGLLKKAEPDFVCVSMDQLRSNLKTK